MLSRLALSLVTVSLLSAPAFATITLDGGVHIIPPGTTATIPIIATSDSGDTLQGLDLFLVMPAGGPTITKVELITGTVFEPNNFGQQSFGLPEFETPGLQPAYFTGTVSGTVPLGIVALVTIDTTGVTPGSWLLSFVNDTLGPSAAYNANGMPDSVFVGGVINYVPEPSSIGLAVIATVGVGIVGRKRRQRRAGS